jgi:hypothetical protein
MRGDPAAGGQIDNISRQIGIVGPEAFAWAPGGVFYFVARNGLYRMTYDSSPECVSKGKLDKTFSNIDLTTYRVQCLYDTTWQGVHIFLIPYAQPSAAPTHFWFDERTGGFWPDAYPIVGGPTCVLNFMADNPDDAAVVLGGWDGYVRFFDPAAKSDDGIAIDSYVRFPLVHPSLPMGQFQASDMQFTMGEGSDATDFTMYRGNTPEEAAESVTSVFTRSLIGGRNQPSRMRIRANSLQAKIANIANNQTWAYESGSMVIGGVGRLRTPSGV